MKFAHALLCALGLSLALPAPLYAQEETTPTTTYTWQELASNVTNFNYNITPSGIIYANAQRGFAGSFTLSEEALTDTTIVTAFGDTGKYVTLSINSAGKYMLSVYKGSGTAPTATATTSTLTATPGAHRFALFIRRGNGNGNNQRMAYTSVIIDGATTLTCTSTSDDYSDGPFRGVKCDGKAGMTLSVSMWDSAPGVSGDGAATTLAIEADAAQMYPITERSAVKWSNLENTNSPKAYYFTVASNLQLTPIEGVKTGRRVILTAAKFHYNSTDNSNSAKAMSDTLTINGATSETKVCTTIEDITSTANGSTYTFNQLVTYTFPVGNRPVVTVGERYDIASMRLPAIQAESPILISGLTGNWANGFNAYCAVEGLAALEPEATVASVTVEVGEGWTGGGTVAITLERLFAGTYTESDLSFRLRFDGVEADVRGMREEKTLTFKLPTATFVPGHVYRGELVLVYPDGEQVLAPVKVYEGTPALVTDKGWVNETVGSLGSTGTWTAAEGIAPYKELLEVDANNGVAFAPTEHVDYVPTCDSTWTVQLVADEAFAASAESDPSAEVQGAVRIAADSTGALKVQVWKDGTWASLCDATEGETYTVTVDFHYAKEGVADDADAITYTCGTYSLSGARPAGSAQVVTAVSVSDGTQLAALTAERELDQAQVTVTAGSPVQDLGSGALPDRVVVQGAFGYGKHALLTYSGSESLENLQVDGVPDTAETYVERAEDGTQTWGIAEKTLVIYPVGDSITHGRTRFLRLPETQDGDTPGGYRLPLYTRLTSSGYTVKYVGSSTENDAPGLAGQNHHDGWSSWKVDDTQKSIYAKVRDWSTTVKDQAGRDPDVILLLLGVNDLIGGEAPATTAEQMKRLLWRLAGIGTAVDGDTPLYPNAKILLAKVLDSTYNDSSTLSGNIATYNAALAEFVEALPAEQGSARIRLVDLKTPLDAANGFTYFRYDNLHPAAEGYTQMARNWFAAVEDFLPPLFPSAPAQVSVQESATIDRVVLAFNKVMEKTAAETVSNYTLTNGAVTAAKLLDDGLTVVLTLSDAAIPGAEATLTVESMADKFGVLSARTELSLRLGAKAKRTPDIADSVCNLTAAGYDNPLDLIAEWSTFDYAPTAEVGIPAQFGSALRAERPWTLKLHRQGERAPTVENGVLCLNGGTVTVELHPDAAVYTSNGYWTVLIETVDTVAENTVLFTMRTEGKHDTLGKAPFEDLYGLRTGTAGKVVTVNAGVDAVVNANFGDVTASNVAYTRKRNQFVTSFGNGGYAIWVNGKAVSLTSNVSYTKTPLNFTFGGTYNTTELAEATFTQGSNLKISRIAICQGRANADILTSSRYRFNPVAPATDTNWSNTSNWQTYGATAGDLPPETETVYTAPGVTATMDQPDTVANLVAEGALTVAGTNALTVSGDLTIPGTLTVNTTGGVSANNLVTSGAQTLSGSGTLTIANDTLGDALTVSGKLAWNAADASTDQLVVVTATGSLTTTGNLTLSNGSNELLGTTTVQSGILTAKTGAKAIGGTLTIAKDGTFKYGQANVADALNYSGTATVNIYGTLEMNNTRWTLGSNNTLNFYPGAIVNAGLQTQDGKQYGAFDASATQTINFKADAKDGKSKGGDITFNATLRARENITLNVAEGVTVNFSGGRSYEAGDVGNANGKYGDTKAIAKTGDGLMKVSSAMRFNGTCSGPLQVAEGGTLKLTARKNTSSPVTVDANATLILDCATANSDNGNLNNTSVITNNGTVELANGYTWISINGGKTEVTGTFVFGFGRSEANENTFKTDLEVAENANLTLIGHREMSAELTNLKNLGSIRADRSAATAVVGITLKEGATVSGTGSIGVPVVAEAGVTLDASESKALTFASGLTLAETLAVKAAEAKVDLCTIQGTIPEVSKFAFAEESTIGEDHCFVLKDGTVLQALKKVTLPESEQSDTLSEAITRALEKQVRDGATTVTSLIATEAGGTEANDKRSPEAAELFTNVITATEVSDTEVSVKVAYDFTVSQMKMDGGMLLLCARVSNVPKENLENNRADYAKGTVVSVHRRGEESPLVTASELSDSDCEDYGVTRGQGEKWFAVPLDALSGQTNLFIIKASR